MASCTRTRTSTRTERGRSPYLRYRSCPSSSPSSYRSRSREFHRSHRSRSPYRRSRSRESHRSRLSRSLSSDRSRSRGLHRPRRSRSPSYDSWRNRRNRYLRPRSGSYSRSPYYHRWRSRTRSRRHCRRSFSKSRSPSYDRYHGCRSRSKSYSKHSDSRSRSQSPIFNSRSKDGRSGIEKKDLNAFVSEFVDGIAKADGDSTRSTALAEMEEILMKKLGIPASFDSTKGKHIPDADVSAVRIPSKRQPRQYMNRRCGFNKPLPSEKNR